jgi:hypothetical protein
LLYLASVVKEDTKMSSNEHEIGKTATAVEVPVPEVDGKKPSFATAPNGNVLGTKPHTQRHPRVSTNLLLLDNGLQRGLKSRTPLSPPYSTSPYT